MFDLDLTAYEALLVPAIMGVVEIAKRVGLPDKLAVVLPVVLGVVCGVVYVDPVDWRRGVLAGLLLGLSAMGLYDGAKTTVRTVQERGPQDGGDLHE